MKSLTPTLKESSKWGGMSSVNVCSEMSDPRLRRRSSAMYAADLSKIQARFSINSSVSSVDDVFSSTHHELHNLPGSAGTSGEEDCQELNCLSHDKASCRQESVDDNTPLLHRTSESVWNSYAARNLRSFQDDCNLENSLHGERSLDEHSPVFLQQRANSRLASVAELPGEGPSSHFVNMTDGSDDSSCHPGRYPSRGQPCRKRSYEDILLGDFGRHASTGLTQEVKILQVGEMLQQQMKGQPTSARDDIINSDGRRDNQLEVFSDNNQDIMATSNLSSFKIRVRSTKLDEPVAEPSDAVELSPVHGTLSENLRGTLVQKLSYSELYGSLLMSSPETEPEELGDHSVAVRLYVGAGAETIHADAGSMYSESEVLPVSDVDQELPQACSQMLDEELMISIVQNNSSPVCQRGAMAPPETPSLRFSQKAIKTVEFVSSFYNFHKECLYIIHD